MPSPNGVMAPGLTSFCRSVRNRGTPVESSIDYLVSLLKRRQIRDSKACAIATAYLLRRVVETFKISNVSKLIQRVQQVGRRLVSAQPREMAVGNVVRRVLGVIREEAEEDRQGETSEYSDTGTDTRPHSPGENDQCRSDPAAAVPRILNSSPLRQIDVHDDDELSLKAPEPRPPLSTSHASYMSTTNGPTVTSMFSLLSHPTSRVASPTATPRSISPSRPATLSDQALANITAAKDFRAEVVEGIQEILEEVNQADDQIAGYALEHIHSNEIILTYAYSTAVQKFLLRAALKRKFTVVHAEGFSNNHERVHAATIGKVKGEIESDEGLNPNLFQKSLAAAGITVILVPDSGIFALMSRVNKVILGSHTVLANGDLVATAGTKIVASAARMHRTPVVILSGVYKLSSIYPFNIDLMMEAGDPSKVIGYDEGELMDKVDIENPLFDLVPAELVDLYITNLGGYAPSYLYRIIADHYRSEDLELNGSDA